MGKIGYGTDFWIVRNRLGDGGHITTSRNKNNQCGVAIDRVWPVGGR
jgi:hypothetical protein